MALPEDEAKQTLESEEETLLKERGVGTSSEVDNGDVPSGQQDSVDEVELRATRPWRLHC